MVIALIVFVLDVVFDFANKKGVVALQEKIKSSYSASNTTEATDENETSESENATNVEVESNNKEDSKEDNKEKSKDTKSKK